MQYTTLHLACLTEEHHHLSGCDLSAAAQGATLLAKHCTPDSAEQMHGTALHSAYYLALGAAGALLRCEHLPDAVAPPDILRPDVRPPQGCMV